MDMDLSALELALAVSGYITDQLDCSGSAFITIPRDIAELAVAFTKAAIETLQNQSCGPGPTLN
ncbi:hypothetical protein [Novosphingobium sp. AP12]|uniref:hypothetical protein n=1 Tax=Novosphingobium sp. AP12 TaxID=1144305 RepID=UPI0002720B3F|nr:hypothetical protein [Novosphingobium sp. AP12]EJL22621.1 hypothetical protein PMI02_04517 [Novosphingobium sp. AP12]